MKHGAHRQTLHQTHRKISAATLRPSGAKGQWFQYLRVFGKDNLAVNRGKRSITLDLSKAEGQRIARELAARSDIVLENYKVGTLAKFGLAYEDLKRVNPRLIYCSVTGFGQSGPRRDQAAYDFMIQAMGVLALVEF